MPFTELDATTYLELQQQMFQKPFGRHEMALLLLYIIKMRTTTMEKDAIRTLCNALL